MGNSDDPKRAFKADPRLPTQQPGVPNSPDKTSTAAPAQTANKAPGRIVHDDRGNAVWDWVVETGRIFIGNTSRLLKRLESPELKIEGEADQGLSIESDRDSGGGYDPYGRSSSGNTGRRPASSSVGGSSAKNCAGGGYDPYSKGTPRKPGSKL